MCLPIDPSLSQVSTKLKTAPTYGHCSLSPPRIDYAVPPADMSQIAPTRAACQLRRPLSRGVPGVDSSPCSHLFWWTLRCKNSNRVYRT
jgi:hypothetical protein